MLSIAICDDDIQTTGKNGKHNTKNGKTEFWSI